MVVCAPPLRTSRTKALTIMGASNKQILELGWSVEIMSFRRELNGYTVVLIFPGAISSKEHSGCAKP